MLNSAKFIGLWLIAFSLVVGGWIPQASAAVPAALTQQGRLLDKNGTAIDAEVAFAFSIYDATTGGTALWSETQTVTVDQGFFSARLGEATAFPAGLFDASKPIYLGIKVGDDAEMTPRQTISSVPFALKAAEADQASTGGPLDARLKAIESKLGAVIGNSIQMGSVSADANLPSWNLRTGSGARDYDILVTFAKPFAKAPDVVASIKHVDGPGASATAGPVNLRVNLTPFEVTATGFKIRVSTWADTQLYGVSATWIAVAP